MNTQHNSLVQLSQVHLTLQGGSGPVNILRGIDFSLNPGKTVSITGPSGSGKTTLLMVIAGLEQATSGSVMVDGHELKDLSEDALATIRRTTTGIVFQAFHLVPTMTALENIALPLEFAGFSDPFDRAAEGLKAVGLSNRSGHYPSQLSGGEQQRVAVARAFAPKPKLLLADEPTGNLDEDTGSMVMDLLFAMQESSNTSMMLVTHDLSLAERCHDQLLMRGGRLHAPGFEENSH